MLGDLTVQVCHEVRGLEDEYHLPHPYAVVGSDVGAHVRVPAGQGESPRRFYLHALDAGLAVVELKSLRERPTSRPATARMLGRDDPVRIGEYSVFARWRTSEGALIASPHETLRLPNKPLSDLWLYFLNGRSRRHSNSARPLRESLTLVGRSKRCHVKLSHEQVADYQFSVVRTQCGLSVVDLSPQQQLELNGRRIGSEVVTPGDVLSIGPFRMQLQAGDPFSDVRPLESPGSDPMPDSGAPHRRGVPDDQPLMNRDLSRTAQDTIVCSSEPSVGELVEQFATLQQILLAQSQQQMSMLLELIGNVHGSQLAQHDLLREQIEAMQKIGDELQGLRSEAAHHVLPQQFPLLASPPPAAPTAPPDEFPRTPKSPRDIQAHATLTERIQYLERERNGLLRKIMKLVSGGTDDAPASGS